MPLPASYQDAKLAPNCWICAHKATLSSQSEWCSFQISEFLLRERGWAWSSAFCPAFLQGCFEDVQRQKHRERHRVSDLHLSKQVSPIQQTARHFVYWDCTANVLLKWRVCSRFSLSFLLPGRQRGRPLLSASGGPDRAEGRGCGENVSRLSFHLRTCAVRRIPCHFYL
jgi:hypothetical protein